MRWPTATQVSFSFIATLVALPVERPRALPSLSIISSSYQIVSCFRSPLSLQSLHMHRNSWWTKEKASSNWGRAKIDRPLISLFLYFKWARYTVLHNRHLLLIDSWESPSCICRTSIKVGNPDFWSARPHRLRQYYLTNETMAQIPHMNRGFGVWDALHLVSEDQTRNIRRIEASTFADVTTAV